MDFILNLNKVNVLLLENTGYLYKHKIAMNLHTDDDFDIVCNPLSVINASGYETFLTDINTTFQFYSDRLGITQDTGFKGYGAKIVNIEIISKTEIGDLILSKSVYNYWNALEYSKEKITINKYVHPLDLIQRALTYFELYPPDDYSLYQKIIKIQYRFTNQYVDKFKFNMYTDTEWLQLNFDFNTLKNALVSINLISEVEKDDYVKIFESLNVASTLSCDVQY